MKALIKPFFQSKRKTKRVVTIVYDIIAILTSLYIAMSLRLSDWVIDIGVRETASFLVTLSVSLFTFVKLGMYRAVLRYMTLPAMGNILFAVMLSALGLALSGFFFQTFIPRSVPIIYSSIAMLLLGGPRILIRTLYYHYHRRKKPNVFIYGAGATGRELAYSLINGKEYHPVVILDDDITKAKQIINGLRVHHSSEFEALSALYNPVKVLIAINNIKGKQRLELVNRLSELPIEIQSVPSVEDIAAGKASITEIKDLDVADLLGRSPVEPDHSLMEQNIADKTVLVTGAGGSIGSELCRQIIRLAPKRLVLFELNEYNLYKIDQEVRQYITKNKFNITLVSSLGSVQNQSRLEHLMCAHKVNTVFHAAAYKHVPIVEDNIIEGIRNNVFGTLNTARAAINCNVEHFTLVSTDKAVRPTNIMGASKRMAELVLQALADKSHETIFTMVRFGNVLGSSGSVVPLFKKQIKEGGPVTVTHPDITRYFMLIPEAAQLVIQASAIASNGQVFVLDMGEPVKIIELAKRMIHLLGFEDNESTQNNGNKNVINIEYTGLRPGEKLYEELLIGENVEGTCHSKIMTALEKKLTWQEMEQIMRELDQHCREHDYEAIKQLLLDTPTGYAPTV
ncbi:polysaccharide biosynthesis protein [Thaumasiovibrio sp. DFM-14]|uniref:polysaccharide biosynthesis protein n=1 Tax=Thaumasiovibrio sp. DFM-14 TaxID=3384792 RepID=UPI0039A17DA2